MSANTPARGYTLIEILVVLVLIGIVVSFARLGGAFNSPERTLEALAQREAARIRERCDQAELSAADFGFLATSRALSVLRWDGEKWLQEANSEAFYGDQVSIKVEKDGVLSDPDALSGPALVCTATGEFAPFGLEFSHPSAPQRARISGTAAGELTVGLRP